MELKPFLIATLLFAAAAFAQDRQRHVVIVSIDGFPAYALRDPQLPLPNLRKLISEGVAADSMQPVNPTVTWPNHTSIVTGLRPNRHSVLYNGWAVRGGEGKEVRVEAHVDKEQLVQGSTVYDLAHRAGLTTAEVDWVAIEKATTVTWSFAEWPKAEGNVEREMMQAGLLTADDVASFTKAPITYRDELWTQAGEHIIRKHKPNLLLLHLLTTDSAQHRYGARSLAGYTALALADAKVGRLVEACRSADILANTTFIVVSDHGFKTYKRVIRPNALLNQKGLADSVWAIPEGGTAMVYVTREAEKAKTLESAKAAFVGVDGISQMLTSEEFGRYGYPHPSANSRMPDLVLAAADSFAFEGSTTGEIVADVPAGATPGSHGFLNTDREMDAIFIASGVGIRRGVKIGSIRNLDVAPTIAKLLGLQMENVDGRVLTELLQ